MPFREFLDKYEFRPPRGGARALRGDGSAAGLKAAVAHLATAVFKLPPTSMELGKTRSERHLTARSPPRVLALVRVRARV